MWVAIFFVAIALTGTSFMLWFLIGLLRDDAPLTCCWIVPIRCALERESNNCLGEYVGHDDYKLEHEPTDYYVELSENRVHAKHGASGLISLDVRSVTGRVGWRSIQPSRAVLHQRRLWFG
jgi:hypothetical protein